MIFQLPDFTLRSSQLRFCLKNWGNFFWHLLTSFGDYRIDPNRKSPNREAPSLHSESGCFPYRATTLWGLDWLNFFIAYVQAGVGPFLSIYLVSYEWNEQQVGLALMVCGVANIVMLTPIGWLVDQIRFKRALIVVAVLAIAIGSLIIALFPSFWPIMTAQTLIGATSSVFAPAICAISLGIVGRDAIDQRQGRNQTFNSAGNVTAAVSMGLLGYFVSNRSIYFFVLFLAIPTLLALRAICPEEIDFEVARGATGWEEGRKPIRVFELLKNRTLLIFLSCSVLFHFADAPMLPLLGEMLARGRGRSSMMFMSACLVTTHVVVVFIASWVGRKAGSWGRKPLLLLAFGALPLRGLLYTLTNKVALLISIQILDGIGVGIFSVVSVLVISDVTRGAGRFNLTLGATITAIGIGASLSQVIAGNIVHRFGFNVGFLFLAAVAMLAFVTLFFCMPETRVR